MFEKKENKQKEAWVGHFLKKREQGVSINRVSSAWLLLWKFKFESRQHLSMLFYLKSCWKRKRLSCPTKANEFRMNTLSKLHHSIILELWQEAKSCIKIWRQIMGQHLQHKFAVFDLCLLFRIRSDQGSARRQLLRARDVRPSSGNDGLDPADVSEGWHPVHRQHDVQRRAGPLVGVACRQRR